MIRKRGFTLIELLVVMAIIALLIGLLLPALANARAKAKLIKDSTQISQVHKAWIVYSNGNKGLFPTPGLIDREDFQINGQIVPGRGEEDLTQNTTANLHSAMIAENYYGEQVCVGPTEPSGRVYVKSDYNFDSYSPINDVYWDETFDADLDDVSNVSYASMPISGKRRKTQWKDSLDSTFVILGNRGVNNGQLDETVYRDSITLQIHGSDKKWEGNICFNDGHTETTDTFYPENLSFASTDQGGAPQSQPDNLFANDSTNNPITGGGYDTWLVFVDRVIANGDQVQAIFLKWD